MFEYEHNSKFNVSQEMRAQLVGEIEGDEFHLSPIQGKIMLNEFEEVLEKKPSRSLEELEKEFIEVAGSENGALIKDMFREIREFIITVPKLPEGEKNYIKLEYPEITTDDTRETIVAKINELAGGSELCMLTLYAFRQMDRADWLPYIKASIERNPVCYTELGDKDPGAVYEILNSFPDESIYDGARLSLPDEVWNFKRGDGVEKAILLADYIMLKFPEKSVAIDIRRKSVELHFDDKRFIFSSEKGFTKKIHISRESYSIV